MSVTRPESLGQARRIEGVTPSGTLRLLAFVRGRNKRERAIDEVVGGGGKADEFGAGVGVV